MTVLILLSAVIGLYALVTSMLALAVMSEEASGRKPGLPEFSVVIAARNEEETIEKCIQSVQNQSHKPKQIIVVDDHSDDSTAERVLRFQATDKNVFLLRCDDTEQGKRAALNKGVCFSSEDFILTTDADCEVSPEWSETMLGILNGKKRIITGPVLSDAGPSLRESVEYSESLFLVSGGAGLAALGLAIQVSGASMAFYRQDYIRFYQSGLGAVIGHGDDVFFMQFTQKQHGNRSVGFCLQSGSVVLTRPCSSLSMWIRQRVRWVMKAKGYVRFTSMIAGTAVLAANMAFVYAAAILLLRPDFSIYLPIIIGLKAMADYLLLLSASMRWKQRIRLFSFLLLPVIYPFFILAVLSGLVFGDNKEWKGRTIR